MDELPPDRDGAEVLNPAAIPGWDGRPLSAEECRRLLAVLKGAVVLGVHPPDFDELTLPERQALWALAIVPRGVEVKADVF